MPSEPVSQDMIREMRQLLAVEELASAKRNAKGAVWPRYNPSVADKVLGALPTLLDALEAAMGEPQGWQPIETAPKDGTPILLFQPVGQRKCHMPADALQDGEYSYTTTDRRLQWYDDERWAIGYWRPWGGWGNRNWARVEPSHWMPLPSGPIRRAAEQQEVG